MWDVVSSEEAVKLAYTSLLETKDPTKVCNTLVQKAVDRRSADNITCQFILLHQLNS